MSVSVVMPVFNGEAYLEAAMESVLGQSIESFEFIIVDDGSTDDSNQIIRRHMRHHDNVILVEQENQGVSVARNRGLERAAYDLVAVMDADDVMLPTRLERQLLFFQKNPELTVACSYAHLIDSSGRTVGASRPDFPPPERILEETLKFFSFVHSSAMIRKQAMISMGGYREEFATVEDQDLWARLLLRGCRFAVIPEFLMRHRVHSSSLTMRSLERQHSLCEVIYENLARGKRGQKELSLDEFAAIKAARGPLRKAWDRAEFLWQSQYKKSSRAFAEGNWYEFLLRISAAFALGPVRTVKRIFDRRARGGF